MRRILRSPLYPIFFGAYPVLALLAYNIGEVKYTAGVRPLLLSMVATLFLFLLLRLAYRQWHRAAFAVSMLVILFFAYGQVYDQVSKKWKLPHLTTWMLGVWLLFAVLALFLAALRRADYEKAALALNVVSLALVLYSAGQVAWFSFPSQPRTGAQHAALESLPRSQNPAPPDIYYFILDSYGSTALLKQAYGYNNLAFAQYLEKTGFYVATCSQSNYVRTEISLGSSLNMGYLQNLDDTFIPSNIDRTHLWNDIRYSAVRLDLAAAGYKTIAFATGFAWTELDDADVYISPSPIWSEMTGFETLLLRTTPARHLEDWGLLNLDQIDGQRYRERFDLIFNSMDRLAHMPGPKFVFIHVLSPHPPFVFGPDGSPTDPALFLNSDRLYPADLYAKGYQNQLTYLNSKLETAVSKLITESARPPVIILQGDHGPWIQTGSDQFKILNAYYLPGHDDRLYPTISPVNTFRLVLDSYLGADYPLLDDISYYSPTPNLYDFSRVSNPCSVH
jgi:hypothetical protein